MKVKTNELDKIANSALSNYQGNFVSIQFFTKETSVIYKIVDSKSNEYALKIYDDSSNVDDNLIEILILEAITKKDSIAVAEVIKNKMGKSITLYQDKVSNKTHRIVLSKWLNGVDLKNNESEQRFFQLGQLVAKLHAITKNMLIPENIKPKKWDKVFYFRDEKAVYHDPKFSKIVSLEFKELMDEAIPLINHQLKKIYSTETPQLLHGDLNPWNIKVHNHQFSILDFEDAILGQPIHDLAILLYYYKENKTFGYKKVKDYVLEGYRSISNMSNFSDKDIELLQMARTVNFLNYVLTLKDDHKQFIKEALVKLKAFLKIYNN